MKDTEYITSPIPSQTLTLLRAVSPSCSWAQRHNDTGMFGTLQNTQIPTHNTHHRFLRDDHHQRWHSFPHTLPNLNDNPLKLPGEGTHPKDNKTELFINEIP